MSGEGARGAYGDRQWGSAVTAPVSIIIPTWNAAGRIGPCLGALGEALFEGLIAELILVDGGSSDDIEAVADGIGARLITAPRGRGQQLAAGARAAQGEWLLFLHADSVLAPGWHVAVREHVSRTPDRAGFFRLLFDSDRGVARVVAGWANWRARRLGLPYGDQGLLVARKLYDDVGGYPEIDLMEDVALARRLRGRLRALDASILTSSERYEQEGWLRRGGRNLWTQMRYLLGADPAGLAVGYERRE